MYERFTYFSFYVQKRVMSRLTSLGLSTLSTKTLITTEQAVFYQSWFLTFGGILSYTYRITVFENHRKSLIKYCQRSELHSHFEWAKVDWKWQKWFILARFWKPEVCGQTALPVRSFLIGQKLVENGKIQIQHFGWFLNIVHTYLMSKYLIIIFVLGSQVPSPYITPWPWIAIYRLIKCDFCHWQVKRQWRHDQNRNLLIYLKKSQES